MKKCISTLVFTLFISLAYAQDVKQIGQVLEHQREAWNRGDLESFMQTYWKSDSLLFVGSNGPTYGWKQTLANYQKTYPDRAAMGTLIFDIKQIKLIDDQNAFVLGAWLLQRKNDEPKGYFTLWLRKIKGEWLIVSDHSS